MLINAVVYTFPSDRADEAAGMLRELRAASLAEDGCLGFEAMRGEGEQSATFALYESWRDQAALDAHYASEHFRRLGANGVRVLMTERHAVKGAPLG